MLHHRSNLKSLTLGIGPIVYKMLSATYTKENTLWKICFFLLSLGFYFFERPFFLDECVFSLSLPLPSLPFLLFVVVWFYMDGLNMLLIIEFHEIFFCLDKLSGRRILTSRLLPAPSFFLLGCN